MDTPPVASTKKSTPPATPRKNAASTPTRINLASPNPHSSDYTSPFSSPSSSPLPNRSPQKIEVVSPTWQAILQAVKTCNLEPNTSTTQNAVLEKMITEKINACSFDELIPKTGKDIELVFKQCPSDLVRHLLAKACYAHLTSLLNFKNDVSQLPIWMQTFCTTERYFSLLANFLKYLEADDHEAIHSTFTMTMLIKKKSVQEMPVLSHNFVYDEYKKILIEEIQKTKPNTKEINYLLRCMPDFHWLSQEWLFETVLKIPDESIRNQIAKKCLLPIILNASERSPCSSLEGILGLPNVSAIKVWELVGIKSLKEEVTTFSINKKSTVLIEATRKKSAELIAYWLDKHKLYEIDLNAQDDTYGNTVMMHAVCNPVPDYPQLVERLLELEVDCSISNKQGLSVLQMAAGMEPVNFDFLKKALMQLPIQTLLNNALLASIQDYMSAEDFAPILDLVWQRVVEEAKSKNKKPFEIAIAYDCQIALVLCKRKKELYKHKNASRQTPLMCAVMQNKTECLKFILDEETVGFSELDHEKNHVLHYATQYASMQTWQVLITSMPNQRAKKMSSKANKQGQTVLMCAVLSTSTAIINELVKLPIDPNKRNKEGHTALMCSVKEGTFAMAQKFCEVFTGKLKVTPADRQLMSTLIQQNSKMSAQEIQAFSELLQKIPDSE